MVWEAEGKDLQLEREIGTALLSRLFEAFHNVVVALNAALLDLAGNFETDLR
jgi:hypothetical protein